MKGIKTWFSQQTELTVFVSLAMITLVAIMLSKLPSTVRYGRIGYFSLKTRYTTQDALCAYITTSEPNSDFVEQVVSLLSKNAARIRVNRIIVWGSQNPKTGMSS